MATKNNENVKNAPTMETAAKVTARKAPLDKRMIEKRKGTIATMNELLDKAGIIIDKSENAAENARANLHANGAAFVPVGTTSDTLVILADGISNGIAMAAQGKKNASILLAMIDETEEYKRGLDSKGKPYTSTLAFARDLFPSLQKSTVSGFINAGRNAFLPALRGEYGKASQAVLGQSTSNASLLAGYLSSSNKQERKEALSALTDAYNETNGNVSKARAQSIARDLRKKYRTDDTTRNATTAATDAQAQGALESANMYSTLKSQFSFYVPPTLREEDKDAGITITIPKEQVAGFKAAMAKAISTEDATFKDATLKVLMKLILG